MIQLLHGLDSDDQMPGLIGWVRWWSVFHIILLGDVDDDLDRVLTIDNWMGWWQRFSVHYFMWAHVGGYSICFACICIMFKSVFYLTYFPFGDNKVQVESSSWNWSRLQVIFFGREDWDLHGGVSLLWLVSTLLTLNLLYCLPPFLNF